MKMTLEERAAEIAGVPDWHAWLFERIEGGVLCTGAVCPLITRGKRKGEPNFKKADKSTKKTVFVPSEKESHLQQEALRPQFTYERAGDGSGESVEVQEMRRLLVESRTFVYDYLNDNTRKERLTTAANKLTHRFHDVLYSKKKVFVPCN